MKGTEFVILTLQYCLETLAQNCQCGLCDPCVRGQEDIKKAIRIVQELPCAGAEGSFEHVSPNTV